MTSIAQQVALLIKKDLRIEARSRQTLTLIIVLGVLIVVVLALGLAPQQKGSGAVAAPVILWVAYLFGGVLCFEKTMAVERSDGAMEGLLMAPVARGAIYAAKLVTNYLLMLALALVVTPAAVVLFNADLSANPLGFVAVMALAMFGFATLGTLLRAMESSSRLAGGFLSIVVFAISLPLVLFSTQLLLKAFREGDGLAAGDLLSLAAVDVVFLVVCWLMFEFLLEA